MFENASIELIRPVLAERAATAEVRDGQVARLLADPQVVEEIHRLRDRAEGLIASGALDWETLRASALSGVSQAYGVIAGALPTMNEAFSAGIAELLVEESAPTEFLAEALELSDEDFVAWVWRWAANYLFVSSCSGAHAAMKYPLHAETTTVHVIDQGSSLRVELVDAEGAVVDVRDLNVNELVWR